MGVIQLRQRGAVAAERSAAQAERRQAWLAAGGVLGAVAGLVLFGAVSDASASFLAGALAVCVPCALVVLGYVALPETRGQELEESAPELDATSDAPLS